MEVYEQSYLFSRKFLLHAGLEVGELFLDSDALLVWVCAGVCGCFVREKERMERKAERVSHLRESRSTRWQHYLT